MTRLEDAVIDAIETYAAVGLNENYDGPSYGEDDVLERIDWGVLFPRPGDVDLDPVYGVQDRFAHGLDLPAEPEQVDGWADSPGSEPPQPDVCAFYQPIHFFGYDWGIFFYEDCLLRIYADIQNRIPSIDRWRTRANALRAAILAMYAHERYHHKIESYGIRLTVVTRSPKYLNYWNNVQSRFISQPSQNNLEDALANAEIVRYLRESQNRRLLGQLVTAAAIDYFEHTFIPQSPAGYRDALKYLSRDAFKAGERDLQSRLDESSLTPTRANYEWMAAPRLTHGLFDRNDNIWTIVRPGIRSIFPTIPLTVSSRDLVSCLRSLGWTVRGGRGKGSHVRMTSFDGRSHATVPGNRRDLTPGVVKSVERAVGRPIREWCP